jgi:hypothetical protein
MKPAKALQIQQPSAPRSVAAPLPVLADGEGRADALGSKGMWVVGGPSLESNRCISIANNIGDAVALTVDQIASGMVTMQGEFGFTLPPVESIVSFFSSQQVLPSAPISIIGPINQTTVDQPSQSYVSFDCRFVNATEEPLLLTGTYFAPGKGCFLRSLVDAAAGGAPLPAELAYSVPAESWVAVRFLILNATPGYEAVLGIVLDASSQAATTSGPAVSIRLQGPVVLGTPGVSTLIYPTQLPIYDDGLGVWDIILCRYTVPAGVYQVHCSLTFNSGSDTTVLLYARRNGVLMSSSATSLGMTPPFLASCSVTELFECNAGDYIDFATVSTFSPGLPPTMVLSNLHVFKV